MPPEEIGCYTTQPAVKETSKQINLEEMALCVGEEEESLIDWLISITVRPPIWTAIWKHVEGLPGEVRF